MRPVVEISGRSLHLSSWRLEASSLKFLLKGNNTTYERILPYSSDVIAPQRELFKYVLTQPFSKELAQAMLGLQKPTKGSAPSQTHPALGDTLAECFADAVADTAKAVDSSEETLTFAMKARWRSLTSNLIFSVLFQFMSFRPFVLSLTTFLRR